VKDHQVCAGRNEARRYGLWSQKPEDHRLAPRVGVPERGAFRWNISKNSGLNWATIMETAMRDDLDNRPLRDDLDSRSTPVTQESGMGMGTIAAIAAAVLIVGALFLWPRADQSASNTAPGTTVGQSRTAPAPTMPSPAPSPAAPATTK
jgi:hypothetical protein